MNNELLPEAQGQDIEVVDIELFTSKGWSPPHSKHYKVKIGPHYYIFHNQWVTREELLEKAEYKPLACHLLYQLIRGCELELIEPGQRVDLAKPGIEHFLATDPDIFHYTIDGEPATTEHKELTPNKILENAGIKPIDNYYLVRIKHDGQQESFKGKMDRPIKMLCPSVKYVSVYDGPTPVS
jgi:hypothetical protein